MTVFLLDPPEKKAVMQPTHLRGTRPAGRLAASFPGRDLRHPLGPAAVGRAVSEALILWTLETGLALALAPACQCTHLHGFVRPPLQLTCRNRAVPAAPSELPHRSAPERFLIFDGNRTDPGGRSVTVHSVRAQRSRAEDAHRSPAISQRSYAQPGHVLCVHLEHGTACV